MDHDQRAKSLQTIADNQRWLDEHPHQTVRKGDLPTSPPRSDYPSHEPETRDQQQ